MQQGAITWMIAVILPQLVSMGITLGGVTRYGGRLLYGRSAMPKVETCEKRMNLK